jgi:hypothetical protein
MTVGGILKAYVSIISVALAVAGSARSAAAQDDRYAGEWTGKYVCAQGVTGMRLVVTATGAGGARAVAHFFAVPENPDVPEGCFSLTGLFDKVSGQFSLRRAHWIMRPRGYGMADLLGTVDAKGESFGGRLVGPRGCSTFSLTREKVSRALPARCAAALK